MIEVRSNGQCTTAQYIDGSSLELDTVFYPPISANKAAVERLESAMVYSGGGHADCDHLAFDVVHYNPSDFATWVDSMLSELTLCDTGPVRQVPDLDYQVDQIYAQPHRVVAVRMEDEDSRIRLVHLLISFAETIQRDNVALSGSLIDEMRLLTRVNIGFGIGKVTSYFDVLTVAGAAGVAFALAGEVKVGSSHLNAFPETAEGKRK